MMVSRCTDPPSLTSPMSTTCGSYGSKICFGPGDATSNWCCAAAQRRFRSTKAPSRCTATRLFSTGWSILPSRSATWRPLIGPVDGVLVRVHSECLTGDVFGSHRCDCGDQLGQALRLIAAEGAGVVVYLRGHEGRGIGLSHKIQAYALQEQGTDTVDANLALGLPVDSREYGIGAAILADLGVQRLRLITNSPQKYSGIAGYDLELVGRVRTHSRVTQDNLAYLRTKRDRLGHELELPEAEVDTCVSS